MPRPFTPITTADLSHLSESPALLGVCHDEQHAKSLGGGREPSHEQGHEQSCAQFYGPPLESGCRQRVATRLRQTVLLVDLVESVRLMAQQEAQTVQRWCEFVDWVQRHVAHVGEGRLVKSLGDGLLLTFDSPSAAWRMACDLHARLQRMQDWVGDAQRLWLRAGLHCDWVYRHALDVYGATPNLAARIASVAGAGDTVCSVEVWHQLRHLPDIEAEDWGPCWFKHLERPVQVYRLRAANAWRVESPRPIQLPADEPALSPLIALVSGELSTQDGDGNLLADWLLHGLSERLARVPGLRVMDALSSGRTGLGAGVDPTEAMQRLKADAVLQLSGRVQSGRLSLELEWRSCPSMAGNFSVVGHYPLTDVFQPDADWMGQVIEQVVRQLLRRTDYACARMPLHNLGSHALMLAGIAGQHGERRERFVQARECFEELVRRHPRLPTPRAWLSQWHVLSITRGLSALTPPLVQEASWHVRQALSHQPDHPVSWAAQAFVQCHLERDPERAHVSVMEALRLAPSQALAWMYRTTIESLLGRTAEAYAAGQRALELAPLGPLRYYPCCLAGHAALFDGRTQEAVRLLEESLALNPSHSPTVRMLVVAHHDLGHWDAARRALAILRRLEPELTVHTYLARSPGALAHRTRFADAMAAVGLPRS
jgi:class 3 adenylate cyclase/tetratricopeptide (TPR) repeat protein/TolB-like protein